MKNKLENLLISGFCLFNGTTQEIGPDFSILGATSVLSLALIPSISKTADYFKEFPTFETFESIEFLNSYYVLLKIPIAFGIASSSYFTGLGLSHYLS